MVTDFLVDLYRSALRYFVFGMLFIITLGIWNISFINNYSISIPQNQVLQSPKVFIKDSEQDESIEIESVNSDLNNTIKSQPKVQLTEP